MNGSVLQRRAMFLARLAAATLLASAAGCSSEVPAPNQFATSTDGTGAQDAGGLGDAGALADGRALDAAQPPDATKTADTGAADAGAADTGAVDAGGSPTCFEALDCLLKKKLWKPGDTLPTTGDCMSGIEDSEAMEADALLGCVKTACKTEFDAFYEGTQAQLPALYACMIEQCSKPIAVCVGGEGKATCVESLQCMQKCTPLDDTCTLPCLKSTTPYQSQKTGGVLECIFKDCKLATLSLCPVLQTCGAQCYLGG